MHETTRAARARAAYSDEWALDPVQTLALVFGMSLYWPFFRRFGFLSFFGGYNDPSNSMWASFSGIMLFLVVFYLGAALARRRLEPSLPLRRRTIVAMSIIGSLGYIALLAAPGCGTAAYVVMGIGDCLLAGGYVVLTFAWMWVASRCRGWTLFINMLLSYLISNVYSFIAYAPPIIARAFLIATPILSVLAWYFCSDTARWPALEPLEAGHTHADPQPSKGDADYALVSLGRLPLGFVSLFGLFLVAGSILVGLMQFSSPSVTVWQRGVSIGVAAILIMGLAVASWKVRRTRMLIQAGWTILAVIFFMGTLGILASPNELGAFGASLIEACLGCFELFLWYLLLVGIVEQNLSVLLVFGLGFTLFKVAPNYIGKYVVPNAMAAHGAGGDVVDMLVIGMMALLLIVSFLFMGRNAFSGLMTDKTAANPQTPDAGGATRGLEPAAAADLAEAPIDTRQLDAGLEFRRIVTSIGESAALTPRETDVMELMAQGYSYQAIADKLYLSLGTIQWHTKNIYRKLGVHTKQEVIELVRSRGAEA